MKLVHTTTLPAEAHLIKGYLEAAGIAAMIQGDDLTGLQGALPMQEARPSLWVADDDQARAEALIQEFLQSQPATTGATPWRCPRCGEHLDPQFTDCWNCGASRPVAGDASGG
jgi:hypothetical protein